MASMTGMRRGEILSLGWERVDVAKGLIDLSTEDTKTEEAAEYISVTRPNSGICLLNLLVAIAG